MYLTAPIIYSVLQRYRSYRKTIIITGFIIMLSSLAGASFANTVLQLLVTQGILYGLGGSLLYFPIFSYVDEWFLKHRGLAFGVMIAGDGAGGVVIPFVMDWILSHWGFRTALRVWAIVCLLLTTPALFFLKPYPSTHMISPNSGDIDFRFLTTPAFWILQAGNFIQGLGHFMPLLYMPSKYFAISKSIDRKLKCRPSSLCCNAKLANLYRDNCCFSMQCSNCGRSNDCRLVDRSIPCYHSDQHLHLWYFDLCFHILGILNLSAHILCFLYHIWPLRWWFSRDLGWL
jgi:hypothetical protein